MSEILSEIVQGFSEGLSEAFGRGSPAAAIAGLAVSVVIFRVALKVIGGK